MGGPGSSRTVTKNIRAGNNSLLLRHVPFEA